MLNIKQTHSPLAIQNKAPQISTLGSFPRPSFSPLLDNLSCDWFICHVLTSGTSGRPAEEFGVVAGWLEHVKGHVEIKGTFHPKAMYFRTNYSPRVVLNV